MTAAATPGRLVRARRGRAVAGVASGIAEHVGTRPLLVRIAFVVLAVTGGVGLALYAAFWVVLREPDGGAVDDEDRGGTAQLLALGALGLGLLLLLSFHDVVSGTATVLPLGAAVVGVALVWRQADESQRSKWRQTATRPRDLARSLAGAALVGVGLLGFLATRGELGAARRGLLSTAVVVVGLVVLTSPWWYRMTVDLREERRERIRSQERAEVAAVVHDSVLQTLALIQRAADDPREVTRLARSSERELRGRLYGTAPEGLLAAELERVAAEVETAHGVPVEVVVVGDTPLDDRLAALVAATREAVANAARHSGADSVAVYAEVEPDATTVFVRDRGRGFEPDAVPTDRFGVAESIRGRMERFGGSARIRSSADGTDVRLDLPREATRA
ncbi:MAG: PspC domain-containing protein [Mycobacteriales bacterium]|nr:PspC domain-containing protein [Mycobacteriales bacterium]